MTNQKTAVYMAITAVLAEAGIDFSDGMNVAAFMTKDLRAIVNAILFKGFRDNEIELDREYSDTDLKAYVSGLQSNWIRKDKRFNGNTVYQAKNPGSRAGSGDQALVNAKRLLASLQADPEASAADISEVETYITTRTAEIQAAKTKATVIDFSALPPALRKFGGNH
jgi:hypothetical protein